MESGPRSIYDVWQHRKKPNLSLRQKSDLIAHCNFDFELRLKTKNNNMVRFCELGVSDEVNVISNQNSFSDLFWAVLTLFLFPF